MKKSQTSFLIKILSLAALFALFPFINTQAGDVSQSTTNVNDFDSIYAYNALENKISMNDLMQDETNDNADPSIVVMLPDVGSVADDPELDIKNEIADITQKQNQSSRLAEDAMNSLKDRSDVTTFLIGDDLGVLRFQLVQIKGQTLTLKSLLSKTKDDDNKVQINSLIKVSEEEQNKVGDFLLSQENKFSLFGWFVHII